MASGFASTNLTMYANVTETFKTIVSSEQLYLSPPVWMRVLAVTCGVFNVVFGSLGNLTTLIAFARDKQRNIWQRQYINIFGLACADFVVCAYSSSHMVIKYAAGYSPFSANYCRVLCAISTIAFYSAINSLVLIGYDRYLIIKHGADYSRIETWRKVLTRTFLGAVVAPVMFAPIAFLNVVTGNAVNGPGECFPEMLQLGFVMPLLGIVSFWVSVFQMLFFYFQIYNYSRGKKNPDSAKTFKTKSTVVPLVVTVPASTAPTTLNVAVKPQPAAPNLSLISKHRRAVRILRYLFGCLLIFYLPDMVVSGITTVVMILGGSNTRWWLHFWDLTLNLGAVNSALNPILYAYTMPQLHDAIAATLKDAVKWLRKRKSCQ